MIGVRLSHVFGKPRGRLRHVHYMVFIGADLVGEISAPVLLGRRGSLTASRWVKGRKRVLGTYEDLESAVRGLLTATGTDPARPFTVTNEPVMLPWYSHPRHKGYQPFHFDQCWYVGDEDDGVYWRADEKPDDGKWYALLAVGSNTVGLDYLMDELGPYESFRDAAEAALQVALDWLKTWVHADEKDVEAVRADIRSRSTK